LVPVEKRAHAVIKKNILYERDWSPLEGTTFSHSIQSIFVNGYPKWHACNLDADCRGERIVFTLKI